MRGEGKFVVVFIALGVGAALLKKSKPLADYIGDQLIRAGEYFKANEYPEAAVVSTEDGTPKETPVEVNFINGPEA